MNKMTYREALQYLVGVMENEIRRLGFANDRRALRVLESMLEDIELEPHLDRIALSGTSASETKPEAGIGREEA